ncbi:GDP-L-fucose synthase [uncultured Rhodoblastus sp.]|uniref:GDP-L-fucose synthase n=1 Tax=uncultured Rhodoblastus sp. TaxID=543037 RepID=UPI0025E01742|nr:GDP-L-fucose synthase [uncultured Rhodoblastus sp.]
MTHFSLKGRRVFVAGHRGMVGSACLRRLRQEDCQILVVERAELDLTRQAEVEQWMARQKPDVVIIAAAKVGGILANDTFPAAFLYQNLMIESHLIHAAHLTAVQKLLFLGSSCIYPREAAQPIREEALLTGPLEKTNEWYAIAKIAGIKLCQAYRKQFGADFISAMPCNLYGPNDNFHPTGSHVIPALLRRFHEARTANAESVSCWGSGTPRREFLFVDDLADACVFLLKSYSGTDHVNVGVGDDISLKDLAIKIKSVTGYEGALVWDLSKPDGTMLKRMDVSRINDMGWRATTSFADGLKAAYDWFVEAERRGEIRN